MRRLDRWLLLALAGVVVALAYRPSAEFSAWLALDIAGRQPLGSILGRTWLAAPLHAFSFRPGSVLILKALGALGTPLDGWLQALEALLVLPFLATARRWGVVRLGLPGPAASAAAALALLTPAGLFNAWHLGELDLLGATLLLAGDLGLRRAERGGSWLPAIAAFSAAVLLKDSVAVLGLCWLAGRAWEQAREGSWDTLPGRLLAALAAALLVFFLHRPSGGGGVGGGPTAGLLEVLVGVAHAAGRGPGGAPSPMGPAVVALAQLVALVGPPSIAAWVLGPRRIPGAALLAAVAVLAPEPARFHVYLSVVYASPLWAVGVGGVAVAALAWSGERGLARIVLLSLGAFVALPLLLRMRADLSTRVLLPLAVPLFGLAVAGVRGSWRRGERAAALLLALGMLAQGALGAWDFGARFLALERVELRAKRSLVATLRGPTVLIGTQRSWLVRPAELAGLGAPPDLLLRLPMLPAAVERPDGPFRGASLRRALGMGAPALIAAGEDVRLYELGLRSLDGPSSLAGSFAVGRGSPWPVPEHSFEDDHYRVYGARPAAQGLLAGEGSAREVARWSLRLRLPPPRLSRVTDWLLGRAPLVEHLEAVGSVSEIDAAPAPSAPARRPAPRPGSGP